MKKCITIFCVLSVCLLICFIEKKSLSQNNLNRDFTKEELADDYDFLWENLESNYLFFPILEEEFGIDVNNIKETTRELLEEQQPDIVNFYHILDSMFLKLNYFAHLSVVSLHGYETYQQYVNDNNNSQSVWKNVLDNEQTHVTYTELIPENVFKDTGYDCPEVDTFYDEIRKAVIFRIKSFDGSVLMRDQNMIQNYLNTLNNASVEHIIFDITGNGGGSDSYWLENIVEPFGGNYAWNSVVYLRDTPLTRDYYFNDWEIKPISEMEEKNQIPEFVNRLGITHFIEFENDYHWNSKFSEEILNAKRWVLIDDQVYSSAESFANFCKVIGWATLVGRRTKGDGIGLTPILVNLPNTGLLVRFSADMAENVDGQLDTIYGTAPDFVSKRYEAAQSTLYRLIDAINEDEDNEKILVKR